MIRASALALLAACGSRTDLDVTSPPEAATVDAARHVAPATDATMDVAGPLDAFHDSTGPVDAGVDAVAVVDGALDSSEAGVDASCTASTPVVTIADCKIPDCCKFSVTWTCGNQALQVGGYCEVSDAGVSGQHGYMGECLVNGSLESMFAASGTSCLCDDAGALGAYVQSLCDVSPPP